MSDITQGLFISIFGMSITFLSLGAFIGIIVALKRIFPYKEPAEEMPDVIESAVSIEATAGEDEEAVVAAIAVAIASLRSHHNGSLGSTLQTNRGAWWSASRARANEGQIQKR